MDNAERFNKNLTRWSAWCPEGAAIVSGTVCDKVSMYSMPDGRQNLAGVDGSGESCF